MIAIPELQVLCPLALFARTHQLYVVWLASIVLGVIEHVVPVEQPTSVGR